MVDDNPCDVLLLQHALTEVGRPVRFHSLPNGTAALSALPCGPLPDVLVIDFTLPGETGVEVVKKLQANPQWNTIPVVLLSGLFPPQQQRIAEEHGALCLEKPLDLDAWTEVAHRIHRLVNAQRFTVAA